MLDVISGGVTIFHKARGRARSSAGRAKRTSTVTTTRAISSRTALPLAVPSGWPSSRRAVARSFPSPRATRCSSLASCSGTYVSDRHRSGRDAIYRYTVSGTNATLKGTVLLSGTADCAASWIARPYVYCADAGNNDGEVFKYPAGGSLIATLGGLDFPLGVVSLRVR